jgi:hypothetical protein
MVAPVKLGVPLFETKVVETEVPADSVPQVTLLQYLFELKKNNFTIYIFELLLVDGTFPICIVKLLDIVPDKNTTLSVEKLIGIVLAHDFPTNPSRFTLAADPVAPAGPGAPVTPAVPFNPVGPVTP